MKKKVILTGILLLVIGMIIGLACYVHNKKREKQEEAEAILLEIAYRQQNKAFAMKSETWYTGYHDYESVDKEELYVRLTVYNNWLTEHRYGIPELAMGEIEEYLSKEYREDGSLWVHNRPEAVQRYMDWYYGEGNGEVEAYWNELDKVAIDYRNSNLSGNSITIKEMSIPQLQELINKYNDSTYEINAEIMGE